jgi:purine catabolism regulator
VLEQAATAAEAAAPQALAPLLRYDAQHGGDLLETLRVFFELGGNASRSAEALYLHRSGLLYRLRRIEDLLAVRLDAYPDRLALELAVHVLTREKAIGPE